LTAAFVFSSIHLYTSPTHAARPRARTRASAPASASRPSL
jgi:hypothetical protein